MSSPIIWSHDAGQGDAMRSWSSSGRETVQVGMGVVADVGADDRLGSMDVDMAVPCEWRRALEYKRTGPREGSAIGEKSV